MVWLLSGCRMLLPPFNLMHSISGFLLGVLQDDTSEPQEGQVCSLVLPVRACSSFLTLSSLEILRKVFKESHREETKVRESKAKFALKSFMFFRYVSLSEPVAGNMFRFSQPRRAQLVFVLASEASSL